MCAIFAASTQEAKEETQRREQLERYKQQVLEEERADLVNRLLSTRGMLGLVDSAGWPGYREKLISWGCHEGQTEQCLEQYSVCLKPWVPVTGPGGGLS